MIPLLATVVLLASAQNVAKPSVAAGPEPRQIAEDAMKLVVADDVKGLVSLIGRHMPMEKDQLDDLREKLVPQRKEVAKMLGKSLGYAFISECRKSDVLIRYTYVEKREKNVVRWQYIFYKPRTTWQLAFFFWDQDANSLFLPCT